MAETSRSLKQEAAFCQICLDYGFMSRQEVIGWADRYIKSTEHPEPSVIDVALATQIGTQDLLGLLAAVPGPVNISMVYARFFRFLASRLRSHPELTTRIARTLYRMAMCGRAPNEAAFSQMRDLDYDLELVEYAGKDINEVRGRVLDFLENNANSQTIVETDDVAPYR